MRGSSLTLLISTTETPPGEKVQAGGAGAPRRTLLTSLSIRTDFASLATLSLSPIEEHNAAGDDATVKCEGRFKGYECSQIRAR